MYIFFPSHIGHHLPFIRNTMLTAKSHIPNTQRGEKQAVWAPCEGKEQWHGLWGGARGEQTRVFVGWLSAPKKGVDALLPCRVCLCHHTLKFNPPQVLPRSFCYPSLHPSVYLFSHVSRTATQSFGS